MPVLHYAIEDGTFRVMGGPMKRVGVVAILLVSCMFFLLAAQSAFGAIKIVKFQVPGCE